MADFDAIYEDPAVDLASRAPSESALSQQSRRQAAAAGDAEETAASAAAVSSPSRRGRRLSTGAGSDPSAPLVVERETEVQEGGPGAISAGDAGGDLALAPVTVMPDPIIVRGAGNITV